jgi:hypothetical protein
MSPSTPTQSTHLPAVCIIQKTDLLIQRTRAILKLIAAMTEKETQDKINRMAMLTQQSAQRRPFALMDSTSLPAQSPSPRYRRPRKCLRLSFSASLVSRLAARSALSPRPSLLATIHEEHEFLDLDTATFHYLSRSPSPFAADGCKSSRKRQTPEPDTPSLVYAQMCLDAHQMPVESLQAKTLDPHWKRHRGMRCAVCV